MLAPRLSILLLLAVACRSSGGYGKPERANGEVTEYTWKDWDVLQYREGYRVINNVWNKQAAQAPWRQAVFLETLDGEPAFGWQWNWPAARMVVAAPEIKYGDNPWDTPSGIETGFPLRPGTKDVVANFDVRLEATGVYNMAFDIWAVSELPATTSRLSHEIMIWTLTHDFGPAGDWQGAYDVDGTAFDLYVHPDHGDFATPTRWTYVAFVPHDSGGGAPVILHGPLRLSAFFDLLLELNIVPDTTWCASVEFVNEVQIGSGVAEITGYDITVTPREGSDARRGETGGGQ